MACLGIAQNVQNQQTKTGTKDAYTQFWIDQLIARARLLRQNHFERTAVDIQTELRAWADENRGNIYNAFLTLDGRRLFVKCGVYRVKLSTGFDPAADTPVEILHTILLGIVKYLWHGTHTTWTATQKMKYSIRLQSTERSGLSIHAIRANYIMQYANSLIGPTIAAVNHT